MCMPDMTEAEKNEILSACRDMNNLKGFIVTLQKEQEKINIENEYLKEKIEDEIKERKDEIKEIKEESKEMREEINGKFEVIFQAIKKVHNRIDITLNLMNTHIRNGMYALIAITLLGFGSFWVAKILNMF